MKLTRIRRNHSLAFNMTPMIDIVFLLIIFFMTVSQITRTTDHPLKLPSVREGGVQSKTVSISINLDKSGGVIVAGKKISIQDALEAIKGQLQKVNNEPGKIKILIRCDRECDSSHVNELVSQLSNLGFTQVRVAVDDN